MKTTPKPLVVNAITSSLRLRQTGLIAITLILSVVCVAGWLFWCTTADDIEFAQFGSWFFLVATLLQFGFMLTYSVYFLIDGQEQRVIRVRQLMWWKWVREFPVTNYNAVHAYHIDGTDHDGYYLQLSGQQVRLPLLYSPSEKGMTELADKIASSLKMPCLQKEVDFLP